MEIIIILCLGLAFYWLMVETRCLTIRLPYGYAATQYEGLNSILALVPMLIFLGIISGAMNRGLLRIKKAGAYIGITIAQHEAFMKSLWKVYRRKQPPKIIAR